MVQAIDSSILLWIQEVLRFEWLNKAMILYTKAGNSGLLWIFISVFLLCFKKTRRAGILALLAMLLGLCLNNFLLKTIFARPRPWLTVPELLPLIEPPDPHSFPSGHTCAAFAAAGVWFHTFSKRWERIAALFAAILMGFSRLYVGVHYPSDVLAGVCTGLFCAYLILMLDKRWNPSVD